jgi:hypothetical protein
MLALRGSVLTGFDAYRSKAAAAVSHYLASSVSIGCIFIRGTIPEELIESVGGQAAEGRQGHDLIGRENQDCRGAKLSRAETAQVA